MTCAGALRVGDNVSTHQTGSVCATVWPARSKLRDGPCDLGEGLGHMVPKVEGTA